MPEQEDATEFERKEDKMPSRAAGVFKDAYDAALKAGLNVMIAVDGRLIQVAPNGKRKVIKKIAKRVHVEPGAKLNLGGAQISLD